MQLTPLGIVSPQMCSGLNLNLWSLVKSQQINPRFQISLLWRNFCQMSSKLAQTWCMDYNEAIWHLCMIKSWSRVLKSALRHHTRMMSSATQIWTKLIRCTLTSMYNTFMWFNPSLEVKTQFFTQKTLFCTHRWKKWLDNQVIENQFSWNFEGVPIFPCLTQLCSQNLNRRPKSTQ